MFWALLHPVQTSGNNQKASVIDSDRPHMLLSFHSFFEVAESDCTRGTKKLF